MEVNERNAHALNDEQVRQRGEIADLNERVVRLEKAFAGLQNELNLLRTWATSRLVSTGATANNE
jgi:predicted  nucleic acid-binding Zn-ribbon protein